MLIPPPFVAYVHDDRDGNADGGHCSEGGQPESGVRFIFQLPAGSVGEMPIGLDQIAIALRIQEEVNVLLLILDGCCVVVEYQTFICLIDGGNILIDNDASVLPVRGDAIRGPKGLDDVAILFSGPSLGQFLLLSGQLLKLFRSPAGGHRRQHRGNDAKNNYSTHRSCHLLA